MLFLRVVFFWYTHRSGGCTTRCVLVHLFLPCTCTVENFVFSFAGSGRLARFIAFPVVIRECVLHGRKLIRFLTSSVSLDVTFFFAFLLVCAFSHDRKLVFPRCRTLRGVPLGSRDRSARPPMRPLLAGFYELRPLRPCYPVRGSPLHVVRVRPAPRLPRRFWELACYLPR